MRGKLFLWSFVSSVLLCAAWPDWGFSPLLFVAFIPLLLMQQTVSTDNRLRARHLYMYAFVAFLIWNVVCTWWVWISSAGGSVMAMVSNSLLMALTFLVFHKIKRFLPVRIGSFALIPVWVSFEFLHHYWDISWPWLTLGNGFADSPALIQWYEYTGTFGGSIWVLLINVLLFECWSNRNTWMREWPKRLVWWSTTAVLLFIPIVISLVQYSRFDVTANRTYGLNVVVVQPNIDPYVKFNSDFRGQLEVMLKLAESKMDSTTDYVVMPETALVEDIWEHQLEFSTSVRMLRDFQKKYPRVKIVTGASTAKIYEEGDKLSATARKFKNMPGSFDSYNTALQIDSMPEVQIYHKSKLVPGVEKMPFPAILKPLENFAIDLGGTSGSLGMQDDREIFVAPKKGQGKIAPVICYESIYGDYVGDYVRLGADFIFIITNDGWWGNTPGYRQHLRYGRLRAIETRKSIARSANTGISCFINQRGDIEQATAWWVETAIKQRIYSTQGETFYTRYGDYLAWLMVVLFGSLFVFIIARKIVW